MCRFSVPETQCFFSAFRILDALPSKRLQTNSAENCSVDPELFIICQLDTGQKLTTSENGWEKFIEASMIWRDQVLELTDDKNFLYHMNNDCYKRCTLKEKKKSLDRIQKAWSSVEVPPPF